VRHTDYCSVAPWLVAALHLEVLDFADDALAVDDFAEHYVLLVQVGCGNGGDEELRSVGACFLSALVPSESVHAHTRSRVRHAQQERLVVHPLEVLVLKLLAVDALAARPDTFSEIPARNQRLKCVVQG
jgi:hypothetical protein